MIDDPLHLNERTTTPLLENEAFRVLLATLWSEVAAERFVRRRRRRGRPSHSPGTNRFEMPELAELR